MKDPGRPALADPVALRHLRGLAQPDRFRVTLDPEGYPIMPGRYGQIEWFSRDELAVYFDHPRFFTRIWAIPGVRRYQTGDREMRAIVPVEALEQVAGVIRAKHRGGSGRGRPRNLRPDAGQMGTSRGQDRVLAP